MKDIYNEYLKSDEFQKSIEELKERRKFILNILKIILKLLKMQLIIIVQMKNDKK